MRLIDHKAPEKIAFFNIVRSLILRLVIVIILDIIADHHKTDDLIVRIYCEELGVPARCVDRIGLGKAELVVRNEFLLLLVDLKLEQCIEIPCIYLPEGYLFVVHFGFSFIVFFA